MLFSVVAEAIISLGVAILRLYENVFHLPSRRLDVLMLLLSVLPLPLLLFLH